MEPLQILIWYRWFSEKRQLPYLTNQKLLTIFFALLSIKNIAYYVNVYVVCIYHTRDSAILKQPKLDVLTSYVGLYRISEMIWTILAVSKQMNDMCHQNWNKLSTMRTGTIQLMNGWSLYLHNWCLHMWNVESNKWMTFYERENWYAEWFCLYSVLI